MDGFIFTFNDDQSKEVTGMAESNQARGTFRKEGKHLGIHL
jgi:hypothetical protein